MTIRSGTAIFRLVSVSCFGHAQPCMIAHTIVGSALSLPMGMGRRTKESRMATHARSEIDTDDTAFWAVVHFTPCSGPRPEIADAGFGIGGIHGLVGWFISRCGF
jgi:hypothetical protein